MKICSKCKVEKSLNDFNKAKQNKDGFRGQCTQCKKESDAIYYVKNNKKIKEKMAKCRVSNPQKHNERIATYRKKNPDKIKKHKAKYYANNTQKGLI